MEKQTSGVQSVERMFKLIELLSAKKEMSIKELSEKAVAINNSSLLGTVKFACDREDLSFFTDKIEYVDLSKDPYFSELFVENMMFL